MKKIIFVFALLLTFGVSGYSQQFRFGLTASPMFTWFGVDGQTCQNDGTRVGFQYGLLLDQTIGNVERYAFSTGLVINMISGSEICSDTTTGFTSTNLIAKVQYIEIPLTIKLRTNEINYITYYGLFGVTPGVTIKARGDFNFDPDPLALSAQDVNLRQDNAVPYDTKYEIVDVSLTLGAGMEYAMTENTALTAGIFFQNGFTNVLKDNIDDNPTKMKQLGIRLGVLF